MRGKRILFYDTDPKALRVAGRALNATGSAVDLAGNTDQLRSCINSCRYDLIMLNFEPPLYEDHAWADIFDSIDAKSPHTRLVIHTTSPTEDYLPLMEKRHFLRNMIARSQDPLEPDELIITAEKLLRQDLFGLQKYLLWGVDPHRLRICESSSKHDYIRAVSEYAFLLGCNERMVEMIETIVDELVTNAIYNAPRTVDGKPKYARLSRRQAVVLEDHEVGELQFACDGDYMAIAQIDPFGALTQEKIISYLNRCLIKGPNQFSNASGGAGIGLYRVFQSLSKFIVNIEPGHKTEVICLIDLRLSMRRFRLAPKSFHIFIADPVPSLEQES